MRLPRHEGQNDRDLQLNATSRRLSSGAAGDAACSSAVAGGGASTPVAAAGGGAGGRAVDGKDDYQTNARFFGPSSQRGLPRRGGSVYCFAAGAFADLDLDSIMPSPTKDRARARRPACEIAGTVATTTDDTSKVSWLLVTPLIVTCTVQRPMSAAVHGDAE